MIDINELRRLAQAATPGPWGTTDAVDKTIINSSFNQLAICYRNSRALKDAEYIAAANPAAINELLDRLELSEKTCRDLTEKVIPNVRREQAARSTSADFPDDYEV